MSKSVITNSIYLLSGILAVIGVVLYFFGNEHAFIVFCIGAAGMIALRVMSFKHTDDFRVRRLQNTQFISTLLLLFSGYLMYRQNDIWVLSLMISAVLDLVVMLRMPKND